MITLLIISIALIVLCTIYFEYIIKRPKWKKVLLLDFIIALINLYSRVSAIIYLGIIIYRRFK